ncbi:MAG: hypothetical protein EOP34_10175 [Rickettsiales bacterium]|nr:MAG: hypothetical protein EOP34_10175 [Rickettsiales bacterium]
MSTLSIALTYTSGSTSGNINLSTAANPLNLFPDYNGLTINATVTGGSQLYSYNWTSNASGFTPVTNVNSISMSAPINHNNNGTYTFKVTDQSSNATKSVTFVLTFYAALSVSTAATLGGNVVSNLAIANVDQQLTVNAVTTGGDNSATNYSWLDSNNNILSTASSFNPPSAGNYVLSVSKSSNPLLIVSSLFSVSTTFSPVISLVVNNQSSTTNTMNVVESIFNIVANIEIDNYPYSNIMAVLASNSTTLFKGLVNLVSNKAQITFVNYVPLSLPATISLSLYSSNGFLVGTKNVTLQSNVQEKKLLNTLVLSDLIFRQCSMTIPLLES